MPVGKAYKSGRHVQRFSGGGGSMKPTNNSEAIFGMLVLAFVFIIIALPFAIFL